MKTNKSDKKLGLNDKKPVLKPNYKLTSKSLPWLQWATTVSAIAQNGLKYSNNDYDRDRYNTLQDIAASMLSHQSHHRHHEVKELFESDAAYVTPKIDVRAAIFKHEKVLLVQESTDHCWSLPGGWCDVNHSPAESAVKEVVEETGFVSRAMKLAAVFDKQKHDHPPQLPHTYKFFFLCEILSGEATPSIETLDVKFFHINQLPELSLHRVTAKQILRCYEHYLNPDMPTDFD